MRGDIKISAEAAARFVLGLSHGWTSEDVKRAYRRLALVFHPDKNPGTNAEEATKRFQAIAKAKDLLLGLPAGTEGRRSKHSAPSQAPAPPPPVPPSGAARSRRQAKPTLVAMWMCGACQMRDLGSSPGSKPSVPCGRSTASTRCFCGHTFAEHEVESSTKPSEGTKLRCAHPGCLCGDFSYVPIGALCTCGHTSTSHDARPFHGCEVPGCTCQTFHHAGACACGHSWACHRTELRAVPTPGAADSAKREKPNFGTASNSKEEADESPASARTDSTKSDSPPPRARSTRPSSANPRERATSSTAAGGANSSASIPRPASALGRHRPSSAHAGSRTSDGARLDVHGKPMTPVSRAADAARRPPGAPPPPPSRRPPSAPLSRGAAASAATDAAQSSRQPEAAAAPPSAGMPKAFVPRARPSSAPPSRQRGSQTVPPSKDPVPVPDASAENQQPRVPPSRGAAASAATDEAQPSRQPEAAAAPPSAGMPKAFVPRARPSSAPPSRRRGSQTVPPSKDPVPAPDASAENQQPRVPPSRGAAASAATDEAQSSRQPEAAAAPPSAGMPKAFVPRARPSSAPPSRRRGSQTVPPSKDPEPAPDDSAEDPKPQRTSMPLGCRPHTSGSTGLGFRRRPAPVSTENEHVQPRVPSSNSTSNVCHSIRSSHAPGGNSSNVQAAAAVKVSEPGEKNHRTTDESSTSFFKDDGRAKDDEDIEADVPSSIEPDEEPDAEPSEAFTTHSAATPMADCSTHATSSSRSLPHMSHQSSNSRLRSSLSSSSLGRRSSSAASVAASAAAAAAAAVASDGRPWWERLSSRKVRRSVHGFGTRPFTSGWGGDTDDSPADAGKTQVPQHNSAAEVLKEAAAASVSYVTAAPSRSRPPSAPSVSARSRPSAVSAVTRRPSRLSSARSSSCDPSRLQKGQWSRPSTDESPCNQDSFIYEDEGPSLIPEPEGPSFFGVDSDDEGLHEPNLAQPDRSEGGWAHETLLRLGELRRNLGPHNLQS
eukprot:TRINITY_DN3547_c0_g1_i2.p1 TRINITY_DN3547_c0_g1~~TRINITY_DN3547_c0_g1_i2.p1  ORF type:complete len:998 (-),score=200.75 TRINITY_DN3547_c0_g1_i2:1720-4713(-)